MIATSLLENLRFAIGVGLVMSNIAVWAGVWLEKDKYTKATQELGWRMLVGALAAEAALAVFLLTVDTTISVRQRAEIASLEAQTAPRRLSAEKEGEISGLLYGNTGKIVLVESYALDAESATLGKQIEAALSPSVQVGDGLMGDSIVGSMAFGVHVTGSDKGLVNQLLKAFRDAGLSPSADAVPTGSGFRLQPNGHVDADVFVGIKPIME